MYEILEILLVSAIIANFTIIIVAIVTNEE